MNNGNHKNRRGAIVGPVDGGNPVNIGCTSLGKGVDGFSPPGKVVVNHQRTSRMEGTDNTTFCGGPDKPTPPILDADEPGREPNAGTGRARQPHPGGRVAQHPDYERTETLGAARGGNSQEQRTIGRIGGRYSGVRGVGCGTGHQVGRVALYFLLLIVVVMQFGGAQYQAVVDERAEQAGRDQWTLSEAV